MNPRAASIWAVCLISLTSCRPAEVVTRVPVDHAKLKGIVTIYAYATADLGRPPESVDELKPIFEKASIDDPQGAITSSRDNQEFVILWGIDLNGRYAGSETPLAHERLGQDGARLVVTCAQRVSEISDTEFASLPWPEGYDPEH